MLVGFQNILIATTGYTGAGGIEIFQSNKAEKPYSILEAGSAFGIKPVGLGARDSLRTEMGYCLYGNEIDETTSPISAGLGWISEPRKRCINFKNIRRQKSKGTERKLIGFVIEGRAIPRNGYILVDKYQNQIGKVTSGTLSPYLEKAIGLGYVKSDFSSPLTEIGVVIRGKVWTAKIVKPHLFNLKTSRPILILGGSGFIGNAIYSELALFYKTLGTYNNSKAYENNSHFIHFNHENDELLPILREFNPKLIISSLRGHKFSSRSSHLY